MTSEHKTYSNANPILDAYIDRDRFRQGGTVRRFHDEEAKLQRKDTLRQLFERNATEEVLLEIISEGNAAEVETLLSNETFKEAVNVHSRDLEGHTIMTRAVLSGNMEIVEVLLKHFGKGVDLNDCMLWCIKEDNTDMLEKLLDYEEEREATGGRVVPTKALMSRVVDLPIADDPFVLAAMNGKYDILQILFDHGKTIPQLHTPSCTCLQCKMSSREVEFSLRRIHLLEAMANPVYNIFMAEQDSDFDPVFECFTLERVVRKCSEEEPQYKDHYDKILTSVTELPRQLIDLCRTFEETQIFLSPTKGYVGNLNVQYPRLIFAIDMNQAEFVANSNIQFVLQTDFVGVPWHTESSIEEFWKTFYIGVQMIFFFLYDIFLYLAIFCCYNVRGVQYLLSPINRCWSKLGSYIYFCIILIYINSKDRSEGQIETHVRYLRHIIVAFVLGHLSSLICQAYSNPVMFIARGWNRYDSLTQILYWFTFAIWAWDYDEHFKKVRQRKSLGPRDPLLIGECFFALATTLTIIRVLRWYILWKRVGPLQTAMGRMANNLKTIFIFFCWTTLTFALGTTILYRPYSNLKDEETGKQQSMQFTDVETHFLTWFKVGKIGPNHVKLVVPRDIVEDPEGGGKVMKANPQYTTQTFITLICIVFNVVAANFLRSTVTGLFGATQRQVMQAKDVEWKYLRAQEWLYYIHDTALSSPLNVVLHPMLIRKFFASMRQKENDLVVEREETRKQYPRLLRKLFQRHFQKFRDKKEKDEEDK